MLRSHCRRKIIQLRHCFLRRLARVDENPNWITNPGRERLTRIPPIITLWIDLMSFESDVDRFVPAYTKIKKKLLLHTLDIQ